MKRALLLIFFLQWFYTAWPQNKPKELFRLAQGVSAEDYQPNTIIVKFKAANLKSDVPQQSSKKTSSVPELRAAGIQILSVEKKFPEESQRAKTSAATAQQNWGLDRIYQVKFSGTSDMEEAINALLEDGDLEYAEPVYIYKTSYEPNDPAYVANMQSYLQQIKAVQAWDITHDASNIIIAIVDSGSDLAHPDLAANIFINTADPIDGVDNDGDGYTDNYYGWDFVGASGNNPKEDNDPNVKNANNDHGVHVSGIASAVSDNGIGVAGIAFNAKLLIIKTGADNDATSIYAGPEGIKYAADMGAQIINCSWGNPNKSAYVQDVVNYALSRGCLIVAAAGNASSLQPDYPAGYPGVIAVANVRSDDVKHSTSNYGAYVSISAPGTNIYNTGYNGSYRLGTGTSMATPLVSGAAALVKARFPEMSMQEVGERLRMTADNIDDLNPAFAGMLGKGRLNVYRALTESPPSVRKIKLTVSDNKSQSFLPGDTLSFFFDLKNFLRPAEDLQVLLSSTNSNVSVLSGPQSIELLGAGETRQQVGPFLVLVKPGTPDNTLVSFRLDYTANVGEYQDYETFNLNVALDYINYEANRIATTITSIGRIGYNAADAENGWGFTYNDTQLLFEASLMIGNSSTRVSDNARVTDQASNEHFVKKTRAHRLNNPDAAFDAAARFDDSGNPNGLNLVVQNRHIAYADESYVIVAYTLVNKNAQPLMNVYAGLFTDWNIDGSDNNVTRYDAVNRMGYVYAVKEGYPYAGVKLLSDYTLPAYYPMSVSLSNDLLQGNFTTAEKFKTLSSGIKSQGLGENSSGGYNVQFTLGGGPINIPAYDSVEVAFALVAGDDLAGLQQAAVKAQEQYRKLNVVRPPVSESEIVLWNYPNPVSRYTTVEFSIPRDGRAALTLYDLGGKEVKTISGNKYYTRGTYLVPVDLAGLPSGLYLCKLDFDGVIKTRKIGVFQ